MTCKHGYLYGQCNGFYHVWTISSIPCLSLHFNIDGCDGVLGARDLNVAITEEDAVSFFDCRISIKELISKSEVIFNGIGFRTEITKVKALRQYEKYDKLMRERAK